jgi:hypothetical protein
MLILLIPLYVGHLVTKLPSSVAPPAQFLCDAAELVCPLLHCPFTGTAYLKLLQNKRLTAVVLLAALIYRSAAVIKEI